MVVGRHEMTVFLPRSVATDLGPSPKSTLGGLEISQS